MQVSEDARPLLIPLARDVATRQLRPDRQVDRPGHQCHGRQHLEEDPVLVGFGTLGVVRLDRQDAYPVAAHIERVGDPAGRRVEGLGPDHQLCP